MGWFSDIFSPEVLLPIAAGIAFGPGGMMLAKGTAGTAALAGAAAGGGLAALKGEDVASGAIGGGLGGLSGGSLGSAFNPTSAGSGIAKAGTRGAAPVGGLTSGQVAAAGGRSGMDLTANTFGQGLTFAPAGNAMQPAFGQAGREAIAGASGFGNTASALGTGFKQGVQNLGGGSTLMGAGKLASTGLMSAGIGGIGDVPIQEDLMPDAYKYDPNRRLDLSGDSGLRLIANGGYIGKKNYSDGGYLEGGGVPAVMEGSETEVISTERDGMSDSIAATIDETQPAALSEGEFVVPADVVSFAGNGSSEAGARKFYKMLGDIREASTGQREQIKEIDVEEYMPMSDGIGALA